MIIRLQKYIPIGNKTLITAMALFQFIFVTHYHKYNIDTANGNKSFTISQHSVKNDHPELCSIFQFSSLLLDYYSKPAIAPDFKELNDFESKNNTHIFQQFLEQKNLRAPPSVSFA